MHVEMMSKQVCNNCYYGYRCGCVAEVLRSTPAPTSPTSSGPSAPTSGAKASGKSCAKTRCARRKYGWTNTDTSITRDLTIIW